jgi:hypothetical protein
MMTNDDYWMDAPNLQVAVWYFDHFKIKTTPE